MTARTGTRLSNKSGGGKEDLRSGEKRGCDSYLLHRSRDDTILLLMKHHVLNSGVGEDQPTSLGPCSTPNEITALGASRIR